MLRQIAVSLVAYLFFLQIFSWFFQVVTPARATGHIPGCCAYLNCFQDSDNDTYTVGGATSQCADPGCPVGYRPAASINPDCNDTNPTIGYIPQQNCPTNCGYAGCTQCLPDGLCGLKNCPAVLAAPPASSCPTNCGYAGGQVCNGSCCTTCPAIAAAPPASSCPTACGYAGGQICNGSCCTTCPATAACYGYPYPYPTPYGYPYPYPTPYAYPYPTPPCNMNNCINMLCCGWVCMYVGVCSSGCGGC